LAIWSEAARNLAAEVVRWITNNQRAFLPDVYNQTAAKNLPSLPVALDTEIFNSGNLYGVANRPVAPATSRCRGRT